MTSEDKPLLTPFPRPNHLVLLRRERERRRRSIITIAALATGLVLGGTAAAGAALTTPDRLAAGPETAASDPATAGAARSALDRAESVLGSAAESVDTTQLREYSDSLDRYEKLPVVKVRGLVDDTTSETQEVEAATAAVHVQQQEAAAAAEAERQAQQAAAAAEAQRQAQEAALANANTIEGAQATAQQMSAEQYGWGGDQFGCLLSLWDKESGWDYTAENPSSGAYGIPQSLPGSKMAEAGTDWQTNATTQIAWGLDYISSVYGTPCSAWGHSQSTDWY